MIIISYIIKDIAELAGVSKSSVSRIISGSGYASQESREKLLKAMKELQYKPNAVYDDPEIRGKRPDIVIIGPDLGVVVLKVKDYTKNSTIDSSNGFS